MEPWREALARRGVTSRELEVLAAVGERLSNVEIAGRLGVSERTVESHVSSLLRKLGVSGRRQLGALVPTRTWPGGARPELGSLLLPLARLVERGGCFGRDGELHRLLALWEAAATETGVVLVRGEPGIGKSRLVADLAAEVHRRGGRVVLGACLDGPQRPYEPFVAALADTEGPHCWDAVLGPLFAPRATGAVRAGGDVIDPERDRLAVHDALYDRLAGLADASGLLFVLEDLHWASEGTREALASIVRSPRRVPLLLVATTRDEASGSTGGYRTYLGRLARSPSVATMSLDGLDVTAAAQLIDEVGALMDPAAAVAQTGGNPLYLRELARGGPGGRSLREVVADRFEQVAVGDIDVADTAVVVGDAIDVAVLATALGRHPADVLDALERIEAAGLVGAGAPPGTFAFTHDVFRSGRYADLSASRRMRLHAAVAVALDREDLGDADVGNVARHACLGGPRFDLGRAAVLAHRAGDVAARATDHGEAVEHYRRALDAMTRDAASDQHVRFMVTVGLGASMVLTADPDGYVVLQTVVQDAGRHDDHVAVAAAMCAMAPVPGGSYHGLVLHEQFEMLVTHTIERLPASETSWRIRLLAMFGVHLFYGNDRERGTAMLTEAVAAARTFGEPITLGRTLMSFRFCGGPLDLDQKLACGRELIELGAHTGQEIFTAVGCQELWWCHRELGDRAAMAQWTEAAALHVRGPDLEQLSQVATIAMLDGDLDRAERVCDDIDQLESGREIYGDAKRSIIADWRGRLADPVALRAALAADPPDRWWWSIEAALARVLARSGRTTEAAVLLDAARDRGYAPRYAPVPWTFAISCLADAAAACGQVNCAADIIELFEPLAGRWVDAGLAVWDTVDRVRALALLTIGDAAAAKHVVEEAIETSRRQQTPILLARQLVVLAAATERLAGDGSAQLREALAIAHRTGARIINHDARLLLASPTLDDELGLTVREREVIDRVAIGETNSQVARALGIAEATVRKHLEHAFHKLEVSTRTGAIARTAELRSARRPG